MIAEEDIEMLMTSPPYQKHKFTRVRDLLFAQFSYATGTRTGALNNAR